MFGKKPAPTPPQKPAAAPVPAQPARPAGWAVQVLTADYIINGYLQPVDMPLVGSLNVPTQPTLTLTQAQLRAIVGQSASEALPEITIPKTAIVALIPRDEASARSAAAQMPGSSQRAVIYAGPYLIRAAFRLSGDMHMRTLFGASSGAMLAVSDATITCLKSGSVFSEQTAPVVSLERAVALRKNWAFAAPLFSALGGLALIVGLPVEIGRGLITLGSLGLVAIFVYIYRLHPTADVVTMALGAVMWLVGNILWLLGESIYNAVPWWVGFLILTICGERLEISRVLFLKKSSRTLFKIAVGVFSIGLLVSLFSLSLGLRIGGVGLILLGAWLLRFDIARHTIKKTGLTRYIAACLLPGYVWLVIAGALWLIAGLPPSNLTIDAMLHAIFLGFVFSLIFGHAPIILPALMPVDITYRSIFYVPLVLMQGALVVRVIADLTLNLALRQWAGLFNVLAILLFIGVMALSAKRRPQDVAHAV